MARNKRTIKPLPLTLDPAGPRLESGPSEKSTQLPTPSTPSSSPRIRQPRTNNNFPNTAVGKQSPPTPCPPALPTPLLPISPVSPPGARSSWGEGAKVAKKEKERPRQERKRTNNSPFHLPEIELRPPGPWEPSLEIGASLGTNISRLEHARREVRQWEAIHEHIQATQPTATAPIVEMLEGAKRKRDAMEADGDAKTAEEEFEEFKRTKIKERIELLWRAISRCQNPDEAANVLTAIRGYESGAIPFSDHWHLIYAGHLVDACPTYSSFSVDRHERLDRYAKAHGAGWLWYEPPLSRGVDEGESWAADGWGGRADADVMLAYRGVAIPALGPGIPELKGHNVTMSFRLCRERLWRPRNGVWSLAFRAEAAAPDAPPSPRPSKRRRKTSGSSDSSDSSPGRPDEKQPPPRRRRSERVKSPSAGPNASKRKATAYRFSSSSPSLPSGAVAQSGSPIVDAFYTSLTSDLAVHPTTTEAQPPPRSAHSESDDDDDDDWDGNFKRSTTTPHLFFTMLLDSGATFPSLGTADFRALGIDPAQIPAQSCMGIETANGRIDSPVYEMLATTTAPATGVSLVDGERAVWPGEAHWLGGHVPVALMDSWERGPDGATRLAKGTRLSGLLPFKTCYVASAPGLDTIWLGEDRRDVLGAQSMPGQLRHEVPFSSSSSSYPSSSPSSSRQRPFDELRRLKHNPCTQVSFHHELPPPRAGFLRDHDAELGGRPGSSVVTLVEKGKRDRVWYVQPGRATEGQVESARDRRRGRWR